MCVAQHTACVERARLLLNIRHACGTPTDVAGTGDNKGGMKDDVARLVETLSLGSVGLSTQTNYLPGSKVEHLGKREKSAGQRATVECSGRSRSRLNDLLEFMAPRCSMHNNQ